MIYDIVHTTHYEYDEPVTASYAEVYQLPPDSDGQRCLARSITTEPPSSFQRERHDYFGNLATALEIHEPHTTLKVHSTSTVETTDRPVVMPAEASEPWSSFAVTTQNLPDLVAAEFVLDSPLVGRGQVYADYARQDFTPGASLGDALMALNRRIHQDFVFDPKATEIDTPLDEAFALRRGVCQDFAHVLIACLRSIALPACYVSGYLETVPPPGQERLTGADRTHAWVGVYYGDDRWIGIDPTNDQFAGPRYITTAHGRDYGDVPPLKGVIFTEAEKSTLKVSVDVVRRSSS
ncbi:UNVERIFIED_CONTAM: hypothetical protein GTU68_003582 [Idotea baltica]|nr:hypothetical protein [Idotea baltica]